MKTYRIQRVLYGTMDIKAKSEIDALLKAGRSSVLEWDICEDDNPSDYSVVDCWEGGE